MLTLNLVSSGQKKEIKLRHIYGFIKTINLTLIVMTIVIAIILLAAKIILQAKFNEIVSQTTLVTKTNQGYNNIREINNKLNFIEKIQNEFIPWSNLVKILAEITPSDIDLYYVKLDSLEQTIKIKGRAELRSSLLTFKEALEATAYFREIEFPIKNILEKANIDFEINAKLNLANL